MFKIIFLSALLCFNILENAQADPIVLSAEQRAIYEEMPADQRTILPLNLQFSFDGATSMQFSPTMIHHFDKEFVAQTDDIRRAYGTLRMLILITKTFEDPSTRYLRDEELTLYANGRYLAYLVQIGSPRAKTFFRSLGNCMKENVCARAITRSDLENILSLAKTTLYYQAAYYFAHHH